MIWQWHTDRSRDYSLFVRVLFSLTSRRGGAQQEGTPAKWMTIMTEGRAEISSLGKVLGEVAERCAHDTALAAFRASRERARAHGRLSRSPG